jgi:dynein heavy chain, axonemal
MTVFLLHEIERFNKLISMITSSLSQLIKAIQGLAVMSNEVEDMLSSIFNNKLPHLW